MYDGTIKKLLTNTNKYLETFQTLQMKFYLRDEL